MENISKQTIDERKQIKILIKKVKALINTMSEIINNSQNISFNFSSCKNFAEVYQDLADESIKIIHYPASYYSYDIENLKSVFNMTGIEQKMLFESVYYSSKMLLANLEGYFDFVEDEVDNLENLINKRFRSMFRNVPLKEREVQDKLEDLFLANNYDKGIDYDRETGKFNFSGREYIPDFIVPKLNLCIEIKLIKEANKKSKIIEEINADITAYSKQYERILFIVYDIGIIRDEIEFKRDIEASGNIKVLLIKH